MDTEFENLIQLQNIDEDIKKISLFLEKIPSQFKEIEKKTEKIFQIVSQSQEKLAKNQKKRRNLEADIHDTKNLILKYKHQLNGVKTNKEYTSLLKEIERAEQKIDNLEEEIINEMLSADNIEEEIKTVGQEANSKKKKSLQEKESLQKKKKELEGQKKNLLKEKEKTNSKISSLHINLYQKIFDKKNGIALSPVFDDFCSMCHMRIRPQVLNELKAGNKIILCENCGRILYWQEKSS